AALTIALEASLIRRLQTQPHAASAQIMYDGGLIGAQAVALVLVCVALHVRSGPLAAATTALDILLVVFLAAQLAQTGVVDLETLHAAAVSVLVLGSAAKVWLTWRHLKKDFGWQVYRALGADLGLQRMFFFRQLLLSLVTVAACLFVQLWLQLVVAGSTWPLLVIALIACVVALSMCLLSAIRELRRLMYACATAFGTVVPALLIYKLVAINRWSFSASNDDDDAGRRYTVLLVVILLALDVALVVTSLIVAHTFGRGLCERLYRFHILARGDVDPVSISHMSDTVKSNSSFQTLSALMDSTKRSIKESSVLFRAFFSGLDVPDVLEADRSQSVCSLPSEVHRSQSSAPTLANPRMPEAAALSAVDASLEQSIPEIVPSASERSSHISAVQGLPSPVSSSSVERLPTPRISALVLSIEELNMINGELVVCSSHPSTRVLSGAAVSPAASWSFVSSISIRDSTSTAGIKSPTRIIPPIETARSSIHKSHAVRAASPGRRSCCSENDASISYAELQRSVLSVATSADDSSVEFGSRSRATMLNQGFDL
ncbi:hypothetical protein IWW55_001770, partial [Coemansia sp. RSA 2706]